MDPAVRELVRVAEVQAAAELDAQPAQDVVRDLRAVGDNQDQVADGRAGPLAHGSLRRRIQELRDGPVQLAPFEHRQVDEALGAEPLGNLGELVDLASRGTGHAGRSHPLDAAPRRQRLVEHAEPTRVAAVRSREGGREVEQLHPEPDVRLVRAVALNRVVVLEDGKRDRADRPVRDRGPADLDDHLLHEGHDRGLVHEAHLEVELRELGLPVAAHVLIAEAPRDLEIAVHAAHHKQLLELLRALGQRVHRARLQARRNDEIARALRCALDQVGRLDLDEAVRVVDFADGMDQTAAHHEPLQHRLAADIEIAVPQAQALVDGRVRVVDVEGRRLGLVEDRYTARLQLNPARGHLRVLGTRLAPCHDALDRDDKFGADPAGDLVRLGRIGGVDHDLRDAVAVPQVEEQQLPVVAAAVDPAGELRVGPVIVHAEISTRVGAVGRGEDGSVGGHGKQAPGADLAAAYRTGHRSGAAPAISPRRP